MLTQAEIAAGSTRLVANKIKGSDRETLLSTFRLYLKSVPGFSDLATRLADITDSNDSKTGAKLVALLIQFEEAGFSLAELQGGKSGLKTNEVGEFEMKIRFALALLGYALPEQFSGSVLGTDLGVGDTTVDFFPTTNVPRNVSW